MEAQIPDLRVKDRGQALLEHKENWPPLRQVSAYWLANLYPLLKKEPIYSITKFNNLLGTNISFTITLSRK